MSTYELLEAAGRLLKDDGRWTPKALAVNQRGKECCPCSLKALRWDVIGAVLKVADCRPALVDKSRDVIAALAALDYAAGIEFKATSIRVNELGHAAVMRTLRRAWFDCAPRDERRLAA
ncbi:MAG: hypothetical protein AB7O57_15285 [Hyphomicrobiaceae bacterium]